MGLNNYQYDFEACERYVIAQLHEKHGIKIVETIEATTLRRTSPARLSGDDRIGSLEWSMESY